MNFVYLHTHRALTEAEKALLQVGATVIVYGYFKNAEPCTAKLINKKPDLVNEYVRLEQPMQGKAQFLVETLEPTPNFEGGSFPIGTLCLVHNIFVEM